MKIFIYIIGSLAFVQSGWALPPSHQPSESGVQQDQPSLDKQMVQIMTEKERFQLEQQAEQKRLQLPYLPAEMPQKGKTFPVQGTDQYVMADYAEAFHLKNDKYRRWNPLNNGLDGAGDAFVHVLKGMYHVVAHPIDTAKDIGYALMHPHKVLPGIWDKIKENTRDEGLSNTLGATGFEVGALLTPVGVGKAVSSAGRAGSRVAAEVGSTGKTAAAIGVGAETVGQAADVIGQLAEAREWGNQAHAHDQRKKFEQYQEQLRSAQLVN